ncbi:MAG: Hsp20/alpha crystallin family protein [Thiobacillaceae bacterium]
MALIKWDPFNEIDDMVSRLERYTGKMGWPSLRRENFMTSEWAPKVDIVETDAEYTIKAELPEVNKEDVKVRVENGELTLSGERKQEKEEKGKRFHRIERYYGSFTRSFTLPDNVDETNVKATFKDGMLNLSLPKSTEHKSRALEVKIQ